MWSEQGDWMLRDTVREGVGLGRVDGDILALIMFCPVKKKKCSCKNGSCLVCAFTIYLEASY